jgi:hypothetical protein
VSRSLNYPKDFGRYRSNGPGFAHVRYGDPDRAEPFDVLIHARAITRKASINYRLWPELLTGLAGLKVGIIGTAADFFPSDERRATSDAPHDLRRLPLDRLMDTLATAGCVVGCSSGTMHLAAACGADLVVWGDTKTRYRETLERRYKQTWNPHHVRVEWLAADDWQPDPARIAAAIERLL